MMAGILIAAALIAFWRNRNTRVVAPPVPTEQPLPDEYDRLQWGGIYAARPGGGRGTPITNGGSGGRGPGPGAGSSGGKGHGVG